MKGLKFVRLVTFSGYIVKIAHWSWALAGRWKHSEVPSDIAGGNAPQPDGWGLPAAMLPSDSSCPTQSLVKDQSIVVRRSFDLLMLHKRRTGQPVLYHFIPLSVDRHNAMRRMV